MSNPRLLIVDDDRVTTSFLAGVLARAGYGITLAADGRAALELMELNEPFDTVLLDRQMEGIGGMEVLRCMKRSGRLKDVPVVMETGMDSEADISEGLKAGALSYLVKPLDPRLVLQVVAAATAEYATRKRLWAELEGTRSAMGMIRKGVFQYQTLQQCHALAALLAKAAPDPKRAVVGLSELMLNALEHGNLGIGYDQKSDLIEAGRWDAEVSMLQELPANRDRWVTVSLSRTATAARFRIQDCGNGFPWRDYQEFSVSRAFDSHGRGILLARWQCFDRLSYRGAGNCVVAEIGSAPG